MTYDIALAPHFGILHLNLSEAGLLIAKCLWFRGEISANVPDSDSYGFHDPNLEDALSKTAQHYSKRLQAAVADGRLTNARIQRTLDGDVIPDKTYVEAMALADWLEDCGVYLGEAFEEEYLSDEDMLVAKVADIVAAERHRRQTGELKVSSSDIEEQALLLFLRQKIVTLETELTPNKAASPAAPITEKQRGAYLNIVGALLGLLLGSSPSGQPYSKFQSQQAIIDAIHANFGEAPGLSQRNLADKFAAGKRTLQAGTQ